VLSVTADFIKTRAEGSGVPFEELASAAMLLHYVTLLNTPDSGAASWFGSIWFPRLSVYLSYAASVPVLQRLVSRRQFNRVKILFEVDTPQGLTDKLTEAAASAARYYGGAGRFYHHIPDFDTAFPAQALASMP
jgi:hypothetical protein